MSGGHKCHCFPGDWTYLALNLHDVVGAFAQEGDSIVDVNPKLLIKTGDLGRRFDKLSH